jgi:hypothetical protein
MNTAFIILWILIFALLIVMVIFSLRNIENVKSDKNVYVVNFDVNNCYPNQDAGNLPLSNQCCIINGEQTTQQIYTINNITYLLDLTPVNYESVCYQLCQNIEPITGKCGDTSGNYITCLTSLKPPSNCLYFAIPVAQNSNGVQYYAQEPVLSGSGVCTQTYDCSNLS